MSGGNLFQSLIFLLKYVCEFEFHWFTFRTDGYYVAFFWVKYHFPFLLLQSTQRGVYVFRSAKFDLVRTIAADNKRTVVVIVR